MDRTFSAGIVLAFVIVAAGGLGSAGFLYVANSNLQLQYQELLDDYESLLGNYTVLSGDYDSLENDYYDLTADYASLLLLYNNLQDEYDILEAKYNALCDYIGKQILPLQVCNWADAVRRTNLSTYLEDTPTTKDQYLKYAAFCRDLVLHASGQYDAFSDVSETFAPAMKYGSDSMYLAHQSMRVMAHAKDDVWDNFPSRWGWHFYGTSPECYGIDVVVQDCIDNIEYEYDTDITYNQEDPEWDYPKHPVETAFRMMGDCEDQAIMCASYLERDFFRIGEVDTYYQTALAFFHDDDHRDLGEFYHGAVLVHIEDTDAFETDYPATSLWSLGSSDPYYPDYSWCFVDPTWDVAFGNTPSYMNAYLDEGLSYSFFTVAFCDIDGVIL
ncbi:MAG: hypothetical protein ACXADL_15105 [Candidatus Thorarchaeota archaeon]|jgi:hypothetical protein